MNDRRTNPEGKGGRPRGALDGNATRSIYFRSLAERYARIGDLWSRLLHKDWRSANCVEMHRLVHNIHGSSAIAGFEDIAHAAELLEHELERLLPSGAVPTVEHREEIDRRVESLGQKIHGLLERQVGDEGGAVLPVVRGTEEMPTRSSALQPLVYLVDDDPLQGNHLALQVVQSGYEVQVFQTLDALVNAFANQRPAAIVADIVFPEGEMAGVAAVRKLQEDGQPKVPVVFISTRGDYTARSLARQAGGDAYLKKPVSVPLLVDKLDALTSDDVSDPYRVLIVDDDLVVSNLHSQILTLAGMTTRIISKPADIMQGLMEFRPDLILMDLYLEGANGIELVGLIRQEDTFINVPIFFLSGEGSNEKHLEALAEGADDFLLKPVDGDWLVSVVRSRIRRGRALGRRLRYMGSRDVVTGLHNRFHLLRHLEEILSHPLESHSGLLCVRVDHGSELRTILGLGGVDLMLADLARILLSVVSHEDLIARFDEFTFMVVANRSHWGLVTDLAEALRKAVAEFRLAGIGKPISVRCSIGVGLCRAGSAERLLTEIEEVTAAAQREGGDRVRLLANLSALSGEDGQRSYLDQLLDNAKAGRIRLYYQPIVSSRGDGLERYEALLRVYDEHGNVLPVRKLLDAAREAGLMRKIDRGVFRQAFAAARNRLESGRLSAMFVKVSPDSLEPNFFDEVIQPGLEKVGLPGEALVVMLPTDAVWKRLEQVQEVQRRLHPLGCKIGLELFGEKVTDIQLLDQLEVDYIKFHPSLVRALVENAEGYERMRYLIDEAERRGVAAIVAFVEDAATMTRVWQLNAHYIEGNFVQPADQRMDFEFFSPIS